MKMTELSFLGCLFFIFGCAGAKIAPFGKDTYILNSSDPWSFSPSGVSVDAASQANRFCEK